MKKGDLAIPKDFPALKSKVKEISIREETLYILENGTRWTKDELK